MGKHVCVFSVLKGSVGNTFRGKTKLRFCSSKSIPSMYIRVFLRMCSKIGFSECSDLRDQFYLVRVFVSVFVSVIWRLLLDTCGLVSKDLLSFPSIVRHNKPAYTDTTVGVYFLATLVRTNRYTRVVYMDGCSGCRKCGSSGW